MIVDHITQSSEYCGLHPRLEAAFAYLRNTDFSTLEDGRYAIQGDDMYALVVTYDTESPDSENRRFETHERYIDVQYVRSGRECIYSCHRNDLRQATEYDAEKDVTFYEHGDGMALNLKDGYWAVFFPQDAHMPGCIWNAPETVKKVVVKVRV